MLPLLGIVKEKAVPDNGNFFIVGMAHIIRKKIKGIISAIFFRKIFVVFSEMSVVQRLFQFMTHKDACTWKNQ